MALIWDIKKGRIQMPLEITLAPGCINFFCEDCQRPVQLDVEGSQNKGTCNKCGTMYVSDNGIGRYWKDKLEAEKRLEWYLRKIA